MTKKVFISGVSSGLGNALAHQYLEKGWKVFGLSRRIPEDIDSTSFRFVSVDLFDILSIEKGLKLLFDTDHLDLVILNAGILGTFGDIVETDIAEMKKTMDVNLWANSAILDFLVTNTITFKQVVAISSGASTSGSRGWNGYGISKAALNMMVKLYAAELDQVHFCALAPGLIDSSMQEILCNIEDDTNFPTLQRIKSTRNTEVMPQPEIAAKNVMKCIEIVPEKVESGEFADIRHLQ